MNSSWKDRNYHQKPASQNALRRAIGLQGTGGRPRNEPAPDASAGSSPDPLAA